ncbi:SWIM zinc finger family protein [Amphibacillus indicireducens]|uniref:SWIM-type domain-containing protein n=1 Tax=Amphibacillus indicireducens TaxID=1076330 RepID=A0ABP7V4B4_9BACI
MNLNNFEEYIGDLIVYRGEHYYLNKYVKQINQTKNGDYKATVSGSKKYTVKVKLDQANNIIASACTCPYDFGDICKHEVAVFFELRDQNTIESVEEPELKDLLQKLPKQKLIDFLIDQTNKNPELELELRLNFGPKEDEIFASRALIKEYIESATDNGFVSYNDAWDAVYGAELVLEKMLNYLDSDETKTIILLGEMILAEMTDLIGYCDDSGGAIGGVIDQAIENMAYATAQTTAHLSTKEKLEIVQLLVKASQHERYQGWSDWQLALLKICLPLCDVADCRTLLENELEKLSNEAKPNRYLLKEIKLLQAELIKKYDSDEQTQRFLAENIAIPEIREQIILQHFEQKDYQQALELCVDGEKLDHDYAGLVSRWKNYRYQAYEQLNDLENQKSLGMSLLLAGDYDYFGKLKKLHEKDQWPAVLDYITENIDQTGYRNHVYLQILKAENLTDKLLTFCKNNPSMVSELYPDLMTEYPEQVKEIFIHSIRSIAEHSSNRKEYRGVCKIIRTFNKATDHENTAKIIKELEQRYHRKPAFLDELSKIRIS